LKENQKTQPEQAKKTYVRILKRVIWPGISLILSIIIVLLFLYKPAGYVPANQASAHRSQKEFSQDITNRLLPEFYNGIQRAEPFEMNIGQDEINEIIAHANWPKYSEGFVFYAPTAALSPGKILLMCTILHFQLDLELIVTVMMEPKLDENGFLNINVTLLKVGAVNITPLAGIIAGRMYKEHKPDFIPPEDWRGKIAGSIFENTPFEPVFRVKGRWVRVEQFQIENQRLRLRLRAAQRPP
jgi:hypothetical protein